LDIAKASYRITADLTWTPAGARDRPCRKDNRSIFLPARVSASLVSAGSVLIPRQWGSLNSHFECRSLYDLTLSSTPLSRDITHLSTIGRLQAIAINHIENIAAAYPFRPGLQAQPI